MIYATALDEVLALRDENDKLKKQLERTEAAMENESIITRELRSQLVKRTAALDDALEYVEADLRERFSVSGQNLRDQIRAAITDENGK